MNKTLAGRIFLTGFMGAGKSTVGRELARRLGCPFIDLDRLIEETAGTTIAEIFSTHGENYFRQLETNTLTGLPSAEACVYATGGGIFMSEDNRRFMRSTGRVVYLRAEWQTLKSRLAGSRDRPLLSAEDDWSSVKNLYTMRTPAYADADLVVSTDDKSVEQVAAEIFKELSRRCYE